MAKQIYSIIIFQNAEYKTNLLIIAINGSEEDTRKSMA